MDTDSIIYSTYSGMKELPTGSGLRQLTDEIQSIVQNEDMIEIWCTTGNKSYAFKLKKNAENGLVKVKGFTLGLVINALTDITFERMLDMVLEHPDTVIELDQAPLFMKDKTHAKISMRPRKKLFQFNYDNKVVIKSNFKTKP